jgi:hypothetical protein
MLKSFLEHDTRIILGQSEVGVSSDQPNHQSFIKTEDLQIWLLAFPIMWKGNQVHVKCYHDKFKYTWKIISESRR